MADGDRILKYRSEAIYARDKLDFYIEPETAVLPLFDSVRFQGIIHDPACGRGTIPGCAREAGYHATGADIVDRGFPGAVLADFLEDRTVRDNIVSNPPYALAERFALHGLRVTEGRVALLTRLAFLEGQARRRTLFAPHPPEQILILSRRPSMPPGDVAIEAKGGKTAYCWVVWNVAGIAGGLTVTRWLA